MNDNFSHFLDLLKNYKKAILFALIFIAIYFALQSAISITNQKNSSKVNHIFQTHFQLLENIRTQYLSQNKKEQFLQEQFAQIQKIEVIDESLSGSVKKAVTTNYSVDLNKKELTFQLVPSHYTCIFIGKTKENTNYSATTIASTTQKSPSTCLTSPTIFKLHLL